MACSNVRESAETGTETGKLAARLNSLTRGARGDHGLATPRLTEAVAKHNKMLFDAYHPSTDHQSWLLEQVADAAARLDYCQFMIRAHHDDQIDRADLCWDEDRRRAVEDLAAGLPKNPSRVASQLTETVHGCHWLLARWDALNRSLTAQAGWDETQCDLAARLLGVGPDLRAAHPSLQPGTDPVALADLLRDETDALRSLVDDALEPLDAKARELARLGFSLRPSKELLRLQRHETKLRRAFNDSMNAFRAARAEAVDGVGPIACLAAEPAARFLEMTALEPEPVAEPEPSPEPDDLMDDSLIPTGAALVIEALRARAAVAGISAVKARSPGASKPAARTRKARRASEKAARKAGKARRAR